MEMMKAAAVSLIPNQMIAKGIQASGGIGRNTRASHAWLASTRGKSATETPSMTPNREPSTNPIV